MKHKIKKLINATLAGIMALSMFQVNWNTHAAGSHTVTGETNSDWTNHGDAWGAGTILRVDGEISFCLQGNKAADTSHANEEIPFEKLEISEEKANILALIAWYGYRSQPTTTNYFLTQNLIWKYLGYNTYATSAAYPTIESQQWFFDDILNKVSHFHDKPSFDSKTYTVNVNETLTIQDTNGVLNGLTIESVTGANVSKSGNTLYVTPNTNSADTLTIGFNRGFTSEQTATNFVVSYNGSQGVSPCTSGRDPYDAYIDVNVQKFGNLKITKLNEKGETVPNTSFKLSYHADMSSPIGTYTTGNDGTVTIQELEPKAVYIQEISVPKPLELDSTIHSITVRPNETVSYTQRNKYERGDLKLAKVDEDGKAVPNTTFKVSYNADMSDPIGTYKTGSDGTVTVQKLIAKTVYIQETNVPVELIVDSTIHSKLVEYNKTVTYTARNLYKKGDVEIKKLDKKSGKVVKKAGVEFDIFKTDGTKVATIATNSNGVALYKNLRYGDYYILEKTQPDKYYISNERINFQIRKDKEVIEKTLSNDPIKGKIELTKEDCEVGKRAQGDGTLQGAVYTLYAQENILDPADDSVLIEAGTEIKKATIKDYKASFDDLYLGKYRIEETTPPKEGYLLDEKEYIVNLTSAEHVKTVTSCDPVMKQFFRIAKFEGSDSSIKPNLNGAEFTVMLERYVQKYGWDQALKIAKDENDDRILDSEWDVLITDKFGMAESKKLPYGKYRVKETKVPGNPGDLEAAPDFFVTVEENSDEPINWYFIEDPEFTTIVAIEKEDAETHNTVRIPNAEFKIRCLNDNRLFQAGDIVGWLQWSPVPHYVNTFKTNEDGIVMLPEELPVGMYEIIEIKSPYGYLLGPSKPFEIKANSFHQQLGPDDHTIVTTVVFEDTPVKGKVKIQKEAMLFKGYTSTETKYGELFTPVYERGLLPGVKFEIKAVTDIVGADETTWYTAGQRVEILTTDGNTITTSSDLPIGTEDHNVYSIREIETAEGYVLDETVHYFRFDYVDGDTAVVNPTWLDEDGKVIDKEEILALDNQHETSIALASKVMEQSDIKDKVEAYKNVVFGIFADQVDQLEKDSLVGIVDVEEEGTASAKLTQKGSYYAKELTTDSDYVLSDEKYPFTYTYNGDQLQDIRINNNEPIYNLLKRSSIEVYKQDTDSKLPLMNVCFELATDKDFTNIIKTTWTDENGKAIFDELETNYTYYIREKYENENDMIHKGYVYDPTIHEVTLNDEEVIKVNVTNTQVKGKVQFTKTGESFHSVEIIEGDFGKEYHPLWKQGNLLGAELTVKAAEDITTWDQTEHYKKGDIVTVLESDWQTTDSLLLPVGKYEAYESKTPHGYIKDETIYEFEITPNGKAEIQLNAVTINNQRAKVHLNLTKKMEQQEIVINKDAYKDVVFGLYAREDIYNYMGKVVIENNSLIGISHIDENGHLINAFDLPNGVYFFKELQTNEQYNLDETEYDFEIGYQGEAVKEYTIDLNHDEPIYNYLKRGSIEIIKQDDETKQSLMNVCFELATDKEFKNIIKTTWTDENGKAIFDELEVNTTYYIREQYGNENDMIHKGYVYDPSVHEVILGDYDGCVDYESFTNHKVWGQVKFDKIGQTFSSVEEVNGDFGKEYHPKWAESHLLGAELTITAAEDITSWDRSIDYKKGDIVTVLESDWQTTDSLLLPVGKYKAFESKVPDGYVKDDTVYEFEIKPNGKENIQINPITIHNERSKIKLDFTKTLESQKTFVNKEAYKDIVFGLYAKEDLSTYAGKETIKKDSLIYTLAIDETGKLIMEDYLPSGTYQLKELRTNNQYQLDPAVFDFEINYQNCHKDMVVAPVGKAFNYLKRGSIELIKTTKDEVHYTKEELKYLDFYNEIHPNSSLADKNYLAGVVFELATDKDFTNVIAIRRTDGNGKAAFGNLELGTYFIREKATLQHYVLTDEVFKVQLTKHGQMKTIEVNNQLVKANIGIHKIDEADHTIALKGAEFTMYADQECTKAIAKTVTNQLGNAIFKDLSFGTTVYIKETKAPDDYELSDKVIEVTIDDEWISKDSQHRVIEITNHKIPDTPNTGDSTNIYMYLGLLGISLGAILLSVKRRYSNR